MRFRALEKKVLDLPPRSRLRLAKKIIESVKGSTKKEMDTAWAREIERRLNAIESEKMKGIAASQVIAEAKRVLNEVRKVPSARKR
jgi:putative addiction module component (TIGR02574 family)